MGILKFLVYVLQFYVTKNPQVESIKMEANSNNDKDNLTIVDSSLEEKLPVY